MDLFSRVEHIFKWGRVHEYNMMIMGSWHNGSLMVEKNECHFELSMEEINEMELGDIAFLIDRIYMKGCEKMKTYYVLIRESSRGNYYIKEVKANSSKEVEHRFRSFGYIVNRVYTEKSLRETKERGREHYLKHKIAHASAWEVIEKFVAK